MCVCVYAGTKISPHQPHKDFPTVSSEMANMAMTSQKWLTGLRWCWTQMTEWILATDYPLLSLARLAKLPTMPCGGFCCRCPSKGREAHMSKHRGKHPARSYRETLELLKGRGEVYVMPKTVQQKYCMKVQYYIYQHKWNNSKWQIMMQLHREKFIDW